MFKTIKIYIAVFLISSGCVGTDFILDPKLPAAEGTITIITNSVSLLINENLQLQADAFDSDSNQISNVQFIWSSTNESVISVDQTGFATGKSEGQAWIIVSADGFAMDSTLITVLSNTQQLAAIVVTPNSAELLPGETLQFTAQGFDGSGQPINNLTFTWSSSNSNIVSITNTGLAAANNSGSANITASNNGIQSSNIRVDVSDSSKTGSFISNPGTSYVVSGTAELELVNGQLTLNLGSDFQSSSGPGLHVYLSSFDGVGEGSVDLGELTSTSGAQSYSVPAGYGLDDFSFAIIYCKPFTVKFGSAQLN